MNIFRAPTMRSTFNQDNVYESSSSQGSLLESSKQIPLIPVPKPHSKLPQVGHHPSLIQIPKTDSLKLSKTITSKTPNLKTIVEDLESQPPISKDFQQKKMSLFTYSHPLGDAKTEEVKEPKGLLTFKTFVETPGTPKKPEFEKPQLKHDSSSPNLIKTPKIPPKLPKWGSLRMPPTNNPNRNAFNLSKFQTMVPEKNQSQFAKRGSTVSNATVGGQAKKGLFQGIMNKIKKIVRLKKGLEKKKTNEEATEIKKPFNVRQKWLKAKNILKAVNQFKSVKEDIQTFGTHNNPISEKNLDDLINEKEDLENKEQENEVHLPFFILHPDSIIKSFWSIVLIILLLYTAFVMPMRIVFFDAEDQLSWIIIEYIVDALFALDILVNLNSAFKDYNEQLVTNRKQIFLKYLKSWMIIDLIACFPFQLLESSFVSGDNPQSYNDLLRLLRLPRLYRLLRITRLMKLLKYNSKNSFVISFLDFFQFNSGVWRLISFIFTMVLFTHLFACLWYLTFRMDSDVPDSWVYRSQLQNESMSKLYLFSMYWAISTLTSVGYGDMHAFTNAEKVLSILWMIFGVGFYSFTIGTLSSLLGSMDTRSNYISRKLEIINDFCKDANINSELREKMRKALEYNSFNYAFSWIEKNSIFDDIPLALKSEIALTMFDGVIANIPFFQRKDSNFISTIVPTLQPLKLSADSFVYHAGDHPYEIFFLASGRVNYILEKYECIYKTCVQGSYFGEIEIMEGNSRQDSVKSHLDCDILTLHKTFFKNIIEAEYPEIYKEMISLAIERKKRTKKALKKALKLVEIGMLDQLPNSQQKDLSNYKDLEEYKKILKQKAKNISHNNMSFPLITPSIQNQEQDQNQELNQSQKETPRLTIQIHGCTNEPTPEGTQNHVNLVSGERKSIDASPNNKTLPNESEEKSITKENSGSESSKSSVHDIWGSQGGERKNLQLLPENTKNNVSKMFLPPPFEGPAKRTESFSIAYNTYNIDDKEKQKNNERSFLDTTIHQYESPKSFYHDDETPTPTPLKSNEQRFFKQFSTSQSHTTSKLLRQSRFFKKKMDLRPPKKQSRNKRRKTDLASSPDLHRNSSLAQTYKRLSRINGTKSIQTIKSEIMSESQSEDESNSIVTDLSDLDQSVALDTPIVNESSDICPLCKRPISINKIHQQIQTEPIQIQSLLNSHEKQMVILPSFRIEGACNPSSLPKQEIGNLLQLKDDLQNKMNAVLLELLSRNVELIQNQSIQTNHSNTEQELGKQITKMQKQLKFYEKQKIFMDKKIDDLTKHHSLIEETLQKMIHHSQTSNYQSPSLFKNESIFSKKPSQTVFYPSLSSSQSLEEIIIPKKEKDNKNLVEDLEDLDTHSFEDQLGELNLSDMK